MVKNLLDERHDRAKRRGDRSCRSVLKKARILVQLQLQLTSLRTGVVSLEEWILQIMVWSIITWETSTMVHCLVSHRTACLWNMCACGVLEDKVREHFVQLLPGQRSSSWSKDHTILWLSLPRHFVWRLPCVSDYHYQDTLSVDRRWETHGSLQTTHGGFR
jgi:hypothetical protein